MISRRIWVSDRLTAVWLSVNMARAPSACKASDHLDARRKKRAVELGDSTALLTFRRRGALFHRKVTFEGTGSWPAPRKAPSAGATDANDTFHSLQAHSAKVVTGFATRIRSIHKALTLSPWRAAPRRSAMNRRS